MSSDLTVARPLVQILPTVRTQPQAIRSTHDVHGRGNDYQVLQDRSQIQLVVGVDNRYLVFVLNCTQGNWPETFIKLNMQGALSLGPDSVHIRA